MSLELRRTPRSFAWGLAVSRCVVGPLISRWVRVRGEALVAFSLDREKLTKASLLISRGELYNLDHSNTPFSRSIMFLMMLCASLKSLLLANRVVLLTKPIMRLLGLFGLAKPTSYMMATLPPLWKPLTTVDNPSSRLSVPSFPTSPCWPSGMKTTRLQNLNPGSQIGT